LAANAKVLVGAGSDAHVFDCRNISSHIRLEGLSSPISSLAADKTCARVVAGTDGGSLRLWDASTQQTIRTFANAHRAAITSVEYHPYGEFIATASRDTHVRIWDTRKKSCLQVYKAPSAGFMEVVRFSPDGRWAVSGCSNGVLRVCDLMNGAMLHELPSNNAPIVSIAFHPSRCNIAVTGSNGSLTIWDAEKFEKVFTSSNPGFGICDFSERFLAWSGPNGKIVKLAASDWSPRDPGIDGSWKDQLDDMKCEIDGTVFAGKKQITGVSVTMITAASATAKGKTSTPPSSNVQKLQAINAARGVIKDNNNNNQQNIPPPPISKYNNNVVFEQQQQNQSPQSQQQPRPSPRRIVNNKQSQKPLTRKQESSSAEEEDDDDDHHEEEQQKPQNGGRNRISSFNNNNNNHHQTPPSSSSDPTQKTEEQLVDEALMRSDNMSALVQRRLTNTRVFRTLWQQHPDRALVHLEQTLATDTNDCGTTIDFFLCLHHQRVKEKILVEHLPTLLRLVQIVLQNHRIEPFVVAAMQAARYVNAKFRGKIEETLRGAAHAAPGVDLSMESRLEKAKTCYRLLMELRILVSQYVARTDAVGEEARTLARDLPSASS
jgi:hypothetical protein